MIAEKPLGFQKAALASGQQRVAEVDNKRQNQANWDCRVGYGTAPGPGDWLLHQRSRPRRRVIDSVVMQKAKNEAKRVFIRKRKTLRKTDMMACKPAGCDAKFIALGLPQICQPGVLPPQGNK